MTAISLITSSCLKETSYTAYPLSQYFNDPEEAMLFLMGAHSRLRLLVTSEEYIYVNLITTDDAEYQESKQPIKQITALTYSEDNKNIEGVWAEYYAVIEQCNILIDKLERNPEIAKTDSPHMCAEAKFLRSWCYYNIVQLWGEVPLMTKPVYSLLNDNAQPKSAKREEIYASMISDLQYALQNIPDPQGSYISRQKKEYPFLISKAAVSLLLGKTYQLMEQWDDVEESLAFFYDGASFNENYGLCEQPNYVYDTRYKTVEGRGKEVLYELWSKNETGLYNGTQRAFGPVELTGINGEKIVGTSAGSQYVIPTYDLMKHYKQDGANSDKRYMQGYQWTSRANRPFFMKGYDVLADTYSHGTCNVALLRTPDAYLTLAEAYYHKGAPDQAIKLVNVVRSRAGIDPLDENLRGEELFDAIILERRLEFAGEGAYRLFDLRRLGNYVETIEAFNENNSKNGSAQFVCPTTGKNYPSVTTPFFKLVKSVQEKHKLFPIPSQERVANVNISQNPGWN